VKLSKTPKAPPRPAPDLRVVAVFQPVEDGFRAMVARKSTAGIDVLATREFAIGEGAADWAADLLASRTLVVLPAGSAIVRAVHLPKASEDKLQSALELNATTFVLGRTPGHRVAATMLPGERGPDGTRTGLVAEWPTDQPTPALPTGVREDSGLTFAPEVAGLAALAAATNEPLVDVDAEHGSVAVMAPTSRGMLVRVMRAGVEEGGVDAAEIARAVGEACVHAGVPSDEISSAIASTRSAALAAIAGGFGSTDGGLSDLEAKVTGPVRGAAWWREYGVLAGVALAALGPCVALTRLQAQDPGARPSRTGAYINRLSNPRVRHRVVIAALLTIAFGPLALQGLRLVVLNWKLPDVDAYERAERADQQRRAMYRVLTRNGAAVTKTMGDIAAVTPQGIELDIIGLAPSAKGVAVNLRGKATPVGQKSGTDALLLMEEQMRTSGMFEGITRSSEPPNQAGAQEFSISATAAHPVELARYPRERDPAITSWREVRYGPPPADTDWAAEGLPDPKASGSAASASTGATGAASGGAPTLAADRGSTTTAEGPSDTGSDEGDAEAPPAVAATGATGADAPAGETPRTGDGAAPPTRPRTTVADAGSSRTARTTTPATGDAGKAPAAENTNTAGPTGTARTAGAANPEGAAGATEGEAAATPEGGRTAGRPAPGSSSSGGLARRGGPVGTPGNAAPEPPPPPITEAEINAMTKAEAHQRLELVAKARSRADLDEEVKTRLRKEFDLLLERCKRD
jgi:hypothetical protein